MNLEFDVLGVPAPKGSTKAFMRKGMKFPIVTADNAKTKPWQEAVKWSAREAMGRLNLGQIPREAPVAVSIVFRLPRPASAPRKVTEPIRTPDVDKLLRAVLDALTDAAVFVDDAQVIDTHTRKRYVMPEEPPGAHVVVMRWEASL